MASRAYAKQKEVSPGISRQSTATGAFSGFVSGDCSPAGSPGQRTPMSSRARPYVPHSVGDGTRTPHSGSRTPHASVTPSPWKEAPQHAHQTAFEKQGVNHPDHALLQGDQGETMVQQIREMEIKISVLPEGVVRAAMQSTLDQLRAQAGLQQPRGRPVSQQAPPEQIFPAAAMQQWVFLEAAGQMSSRGSQPDDVMSPSMGMLACPATVPMPIQTATPKRIGTPIERMYYPQKDVSDPSWRMSSTHGSRMMPGEESQDTWQDVPGWRGVAGYNEELQDAIYLRDGVQAAADRLLAARPSTVMTPNVRTPSRTPSPIWHGSKNSVLQPVAESLPPQDRQWQHCAKQSDVVIPVKDTFVHYSEGLQSNSCSLQSSIPHRLEKSVSAPATLMRSPSSSCAETPVLLNEAPSRDEAVNVLHGLGKCNPCAYFNDKEDGCRRGKDCNFCHQCPSGEIKKRKKEKRAMIQARKLAMELGTPYRVN